MKENALLAIVVFAWNQALYLVMAVWACWATISCFVHIKLL